MSLLNTHLFNPIIIDKIESLGPMAEQIADRWAGGWPKKTKALEKSGKLLEALKEQVEKEKDVIAGAYGNGNLARHEIMELYGVNPEPPEA